jgi:hypothetical protein
MAKSESESLDTLESAPRAGAGKRFLKQRKDEVLEILSDVEGASEGIRH